MISVERQQTESRVNPAGVTHTWSATEILEGVAYTASII